MSTPVRRWPWRRRRTARWRVLALTTWVVPRRAQALAAWLTRHRRERGQALVEFLIVLGLFLTLILGLVCMGQLLLANYTVNQAARVAAHQAALAGGGTDAARLAADQVLDSGVGTSADSTHASVSIVCEDPAHIGPSDEPGDPANAATTCRRYYPVTVRVSYHDTFWTPLPMFTEFTVQAQATRAAERDQQ